MKNLLALLIAAWFIGCSSGSNQQSETVDSDRADVNGSSAPTTEESLGGWQEMFEQHEEAVVLIKADYADESFFYGSGFFVAPDVVATCKHVVDPLYNLSRLIRITIEFNDGTDKEVSGIDYSLAERNLALLSIADIDVAPLVLASDMSMMDSAGEIMAIETSLSQPWTYSSSHAKACDDAGNIAGLDWLDSDTRIVQHGLGMVNKTSGSPLFNSQGYVIAVNFSDNPTSSTSGDFEYGVSAAYIAEYIDGVAFESISGLDPSMDVMEGRNSSQTEIDPLINTWQLVSDVRGASVTDIFIFTETVSMDGAYVAVGRDELNRSALAGYDPDEDMYFILCEGEEIDQFFTFRISTNDSITGCYMEYSYERSAWSDCYEMNGSSVVMTDTSLSR